ncbi:MAG: PIN domain-containing protein [Pleurocapsa minor HA4230-MV1]|nr:PIN domain-containing protein [Pleurocapsa minor HA4230-MV1]
MKVFLDANILFSAAAPKSNVAKLIDLVQKHGQCVTSPYAVEEARKNLQLKQFGSLEIFELLLTTVTISNKLVLDLPVTIKSKDIPILGSAIAQQCTYLLTGDKRDFGLFFGKTIAGVMVVSPRLLAEDLVNKGFLPKR